MRASAYSIKAGPRARIASMEISRILVDKNNPPSIVCADPVHNRNKTDPRWVRSFRHRERLST